MMKEKPTDIDSALECLVAREDQVKKLQLNGRVELDFSCGMRTLQLRADGLAVDARLTSALIHQIGARVWPNLTASKTRELWVEQPVEKLQVMLENALSESGLIVRYREEESGPQLYGLTSPQFVEMDQRVFRRSLLEAMEPLGIVPGGAVFETAYKEVVEEFSTPAALGAIGLTCRVIYGLNTGYSSYRLRWGRVVLICTNGMTAFRDAGRNRWIHSNQVDIADFVNSSVHGAYDRLSALEQRILSAQARTLDDSRLNVFLDRLHVARATKERIQDRLHMELSDTGENEWSVSQALTYLGSHEKAIPPRVRNHLTSLGTKVIDEDLSRVTASPHLNMTANAYEYVPY